MSRRILFATHGAPPRGSTNAWAYNLFEKMRRAALDVVYVNLLEEADEFFFRYCHGDDFADPRHLGVLSCPIGTPLGRDQPRLAELILSCAPDLLVAWDVEAALVLRKAAPSRPLVLVTAGCRQVDRLIEERAIRDGMSFRGAVELGVRFPVVDQAELNAVRSCDLLVSTSTAARFALGHFFPFQADKSYARSASPADLVSAESEEYAGVRRPFAERDVDVLFADVDWRPRARNLAVVKRIAAGFGNGAMHIVGENCEGVPRAHLHGLPRRRSDLFELLGRTKVLACPNLSDAGTGFLFEASAMGCNVVASESSGYAELCADALRVSGRDAAALAGRIRQALSRPFDDHRERFAGGTEDLVETLSVF